MRIVFFGTSSFAAFILKDLLTAPLVDLVAVVTRPDRPRGRKLHLSYSPVKEMALAVCPKVPLFQPEKASHAEFAELLSKIGADLFIVVAYGEIIKSNLLDLPLQGCINIHASLLPRFRGAAPMQRALFAGEKETGITIIEMTPAMDAGDMLAQEAIPVPEAMTLGQLEEKLRPLAAKLLRQVVAKIQKNGKFAGEAQDPNLVTFAPKLAPGEEKIDWTLPAHKIHNQIRALSPVPGAWCELKIGNESKRLKIKQACQESFLIGPPGSFLQCSAKQGWVVACGDGALRLLVVQIEGKKEMGAEECIRGFPPGVELKIII